MSKSRFSNSGLCATRLPTRVLVFGKKSELKLVSHAAVAIIVLAQFNVEPKQNVLMFKTNTDFDCYCKMMTAGNFR